MIDTFLEKIQQRYPSSGLPLGRIGRELGRGCEGRVYEFGGLAALKIVTRRHRQHASKPIVDLIRWFSNRPHPHIVRPYYAAELDSQAYWYCMERLTPLSSAETNDFKRVIRCIWDGESIERYSPRSEVGRQRKSFVQSLQSFPYRHGDLLAKNVMKNANGIWKIVDLESFDIPRLILRAEAKKYE